MAISNFWMLKFLYVQDELWQVEVIFQLKQNCVRL